MVHQQGDDENETDGVVSDVQNHCLSRMNGNSHTHLPNLELARGHSSVTADSSKVSHPMLETHQPQHGSVVTEHEISMSAISAATDESENTGACSAYSLPKQGSTQRPSFPTNAAYNEGSETALSTSTVKSSWSMLSITTKITVPEMKAIVPSIDVIEKSEPRSTTVEGQESGCSELDKIAEIDGVSETKPNPPLLPQQQGWVNPKLEHIPPDSAPSSEYVSGVNPQSFGNFKKNNTKHSRQPSFLETAIANLGISLDPKTFNSVPCNPSLDLSDTEYLNALFNIAPVNLLTMRFEDSLIERTYKGKENLFWVRKNMSMAIIVTFLSALVIVAGGIARGFAYFIYMIPYLVG
jgi:hypothetical protein